MKNLLQYLQRCVDDPTRPGYVEMPKTIIRDLIQVTEERDELQQLFNLQWRADQRAIKRWQAAHPGNDLVWPDHTNMVVWLMEQHDAYAQGAPTITDEMVDAAAREMWNDRDARHGGGWDTRDSQEVCVIQTKATARAALMAALTKK